MAAHMVRQVLLVYEGHKALFVDVDQATVETRKSLYEELGLLNVPRQSDTLHLTRTGSQLLALLGSLSLLSEFWGPPQCSYSLALAPNSLLY